MLWQRLFLLSAVGKCVGLHLPVGIVDCLHQTIMLTHQTGVLALDRVERRNFFLHVSNPHGDFVNFSLSFHVASVVRNIV